MTPPLRARLAGVLALAVTACVADGGADARLDRAAVDAIDTTDELLRAVAFDGITAEAAPLAAARAAADPPAVFTASGDFVDLVPRFVTQVLDAEADTLATLVAVGLDGLARDTWKSAVDITELNAEFGAIEANQRIYLETGTYGGTDYFGDLRVGCEDAGVDSETRWNTLLAVLDLAAVTPLRHGSFIAGLDVDDLATLTVDGDQPVPDNAPALIAEVGSQLEAVLVAALYEDLEARTVLVGDVGLDTFAADPFIADVIDPDTGDLGRRVSDALGGLLEE